MLVGMQVGSVRVENSMEMTKKKNEMELPYDPAILLLSIHLKNMKILA